MTLLGQGDPAVVRESLLRVEVGTAIGALAKGVSQTSIQDDFYRELSRLKLDQFKTGVKRDLDLDLRENRRVKTAEAAFLDLHRSSFLHRLAVLEVPFGKKLEVRQEGTTWAERWVLQWTPEAEIAIVEAVLLGETIELAVAFKFKQRLEKCTSISEAATIIRQARLRRKAELVLNLLVAIPGPKWTCSPGSSIVAVVARSRSAERGVRPMGRS